MPIDDVFQGNKQDEIQKVQRENIIRYLLSMCTLMSLLFACWHLFNVANFALLVFLRYATYESESYILSFFFF